MGLPVRLETRTGDTPASKRQRQRRDPPDILLTTPEQLALLLATADAPYLFGTLKRVVLDELHSLVTSKRGDLLVARPGAAVRAGAAAHHRRPVRHRGRARRALPLSGAAAAATGDARADLVVAQGRRAAARHHARHRASICPGPAIRRATRSREIYDADQAHKTTLVFVNTRSQAEYLFQELWRDQRRQSRHRAASRLARRGAAPQGRGRHGGRQTARGGVHLVARSRRRLGRRRSGDQCRRAEGLLAAAAAHRPLQSPARRAVAARVLVPANRFEVLECRAAIDAVAENAQDTPPLRTGALDVLAQHILGRACGEPFLADELYAEVRAAAPYAGARARRFRRRGRFRRHRRLRAESL